MTTETDIGNEMIASSDQGLREQALQTRALGWGVGLVCNAWDVYLRRPLTQAELHREMDRLREHR
jgi:hypothetical protein